MNSTLAELALPFDEALDSIGISARITEIAFHEKIPATFDNSEYVISGTDTDLVFESAPLQHTCEYEWRFAKCSCGSKTGEFVLAALRETEHKISCKALLRIEIRRKALPVPLIVEGLPETGMIHASFKTWSYTEYHKALEAMSKKFTPVSHCVEKYGLCSYWKIPGHQAFLKPRLNLRDVKS